MSQHTERPRLPAIQTDEEYRRLLGEAQALCERDPDPMTDDGARLMQLAVAIEVWETDHYPIREAKND